MRHKQDASNMVMPDKQSETGRISPKLFLKTAIYTNETTKNGDFWKLYVYEIGVSLDI